MLKLTAVPRINLEDHHKLHPEPTNKRAEWTAKIPEKKKLGTIFLFWYNVHGRQMLVR